MLMASLETFKESEKEVKEKPLYRSTRLPASHWQKFVRLLWRMQKGRSPQQKNPSTKQGNGEIWIPIAIIKMK